MPRRAHSLDPVMSGFVCVLLAAVLAGISSPAQAECIVQPNQQAPDGSHWSLHFDRVKNRRCWILVDAAGHDISSAPAEPAAMSGFSSLQAFLGNFTGAQPAPPQTSQEAAPANPPRKPPAHLANAGRPDQGARPEPKGEVHIPKHGMTQGERNALFQEFLRWRESQQITGAVTRPSR